MLTVWRNDYCVFTHWLKVERTVTVRDHGVNAAHLRGHGPFAFFAADSAGAQLLVVLDHDAGFILQGADHAVRAVNDQPPSDIAKSLEEFPLGMHIQLLCF